MYVDAKKMTYTDINNMLRESDEDCVIKNCLGHRFLAAGLGKKSITIEGIPGNALGAYLSGAKIEILGNAQDAVGDTMNCGEIIVHGNIGDTAGYAMRGGEIYVEKNAGYRAGIHMKAYKERKPVIVIGGHTGSFLGEYQAGGLIIVLGIYDDGKPIVGNFPSMGMHGGKMFLRGDVSDVRFSDRTIISKASKDDLSEIRPYLEKYCRYFDKNIEDVMSEDFTVVTPDSKNPYKQMYVAN